MGAGRLHPQWKIQGALEAIFLYHKRHGLGIERIVVLAD